MKTLYKYSRFLVLALLLIGCRGQIPFEVGNPGGPEFGPTFNARDVWNSQGITFYAIEQRWQCFCAVPHGFVELIVRDGQIITGTDLDSGEPVPADQLKYYQTVEGLFRLIDTVAADEPVYFEVEYDSTYGYPTLIAYDYRKEVADDEIRIEQRNFRALKAN